MSLASEYRLEIKYQDPRDLVPYIRNPRKITEGDVDRVAALITEFGFLGVILVKGKQVVDGHLRRLGAIKLDKTEVPTADVSHLSDAQIKALRIAMNKSAEWVDWDTDLLKLEFEELRVAGVDLELTGWTLPEIDALALPSPQGEGDGQGGEGGGPGSGQPEDKGSLLKLTEVVIGEPKTAVQLHEVWRLGIHALACACPHEDWQLWTTLLRHPDDLFIPYPGPWVALGEKAKTRTLVLVQPDTFIAGHIIDRWAEINGRQSVERINP